MNGMDNSSIEEIAVHFFKGLFFKVNRLKTIFTEGDKTPLVDGSLFSCWGNRVQLVVGRTLFCVSR